MGGRIYRYCQWYDPTSNNPRSLLVLLEITDDIFCCEGRNKTPNVPGFTLEEVAYILRDLGCLDAMNLDGGGSSCMLVKDRRLSSQVMVHNVL